jgi:uncharacterized coiled-coil DUF342 family protein
MGFEEAVDKLFNNRLNELNHELYQSHELLEMSNKERDIALSDAKKVKKERDNAISDAKMAHEQVNHLTQTIKELIKQGKLTDEDLAAAGITL